MRVPFLVARTRSAAETTSLGRRIGEIVRPGEILLFTGELGTGKTTFIQGLAKGLGSSGPVRSPTFTLMRTHDGGRCPLVHVDLYRLEGSVEVSDLGLEDLLAPPAVGAVEWGEKAFGVVGPDYLEVELSWDEATEDTRTIRFLPSGRWRERMSELGDAVRSWAASEGAEGE